jgi:crotonobetaine/carnitine-CoA ligase
MRMPRNIRELIETQTAKNPDKVFLYFEDREITYAQFNASINRAANVFLELGIKKGDRVCFFMPNCPEFHYGWLGLAKMGGVMVPINTNYRTEETKYIVNHSEAKAILVHASLKQVIDSIRPETPLLEHFLLAGGDAIDGNYRSFEKALALASLDLVPIYISEDDLLEILYTSGTTGPSKGAMMSHRYWYMTGAGFVYSLEIESEDRLFTCLPLFHANAQGYSTMGSLIAGASLILMDKFSATRFWDQIRLYKATEFNFIGAMLTILSKQPETDRDREHRVRLAYGTPGLSRQFEEYMVRRFGIKFYSGYGLTECGLGTMTPIHGTWKEKTMGLPRQIPIPGFVNEIKIVKDQGEDIPPGTIGEIAMRNPGMMTGYFKEPELTAKVIRNGWLYTGDQGWMDADGYFFFADRKKDVIRRRGENVSSIEVEAVINAHPKVLESAVIGVASEFQDDELKAYIVSRPNETIDPLEIVRWCKERLAYFKVPRFIEFRSELPKTPTLRVQKYKLREEKKDLTQDCFDLAKTGFNLR